MKTVEIIKSIEKILEEKLGLEWKDSFENRYTGTSSNGEFEFSLEIIGYWIGDCQLLWYKIDLVENQYYLIINISDRIIDERYSSADELIEAIENYLGDESTSSYLKEFKELDKFIGEKYREENQLKDKKRDNTNKQ